MKSEDRELHNNGRQPGLLEQYAHLTTNRRQSGGRSGVVGTGGKPGAAIRVAQGTIKRLMADRGFGFIQEEGETATIFFHRSDVAGNAFEELKEGDFVKFEVRRDLRRNRIHAVDVKRVERLESSAPSPRRPKTMAGRIYHGWQADAVYREQRDWGSQRRTPGLGSGESSRPRRP
ncbi:MAG: cold shock domain-containing protein [Chloroflexi bacterium]|nr:cold shock domain-containing protein [Chloroflexota bacterium]